MDTKWNNTDKDPSELTGPELIKELEKTFGSKPEGHPAVTLSRRGLRPKALAGFLAFVLGVSLTLSSLGSVGSRIVWERDLIPRFTRDWQETDNFRQEVSSSLKKFLTIGAGGRLDLYDYSYWADYSGETTVMQEEAYRSWWGFGFGGAFDSAVAVDRGTASTESVPSRLEPEEKQDPDTAYRNDKNVLYYIRNDESGEPILYSNAGDKLDQLLARSVEGYNFYLQFADGKASIVKDGQTLDVYGSGIYSGDSQWFVPGYDNFPATDQLDGVKVVMAVRETPIHYYSVDYKTGGSYYNSSMYYVAQRVEETWTFYRTQAALFGAGVLCLFLWFVLRRHTITVNRRIASWTLYVWTEVRFLIGLLLTAGLFSGLASGELYYLLRDAYYWDGGYADIWMALARLALSNVPSLLGLIWFIWLIRNDHKHNPREVRRSLLRPFLRGLRARDLKRPVEKRLSRRAALLSLVILMLGGEILFFLILLTDTYILPVWALWTLFLLPVLLAGLAASFLTQRQYKTAKDLGRLADQVEAVRAGDLSKPLVLPEDADLRQTADSLNDIQAGMKAALEEQTRSERMKVELVSNVSHDLKTPLTSILSYAELLRQEEDLPPAAADYARIIDEKAQRLKGMVEDVFEISKAAADQLPVHLERLDLAKLLRQTLADLDGPIQRSALTFKVELPEEPVMITADGRRLYRVFQNLIDNALRYALEGSRVYLSLKTAEGTAETVRRAQVSVRNTSRSELPEGVDFTARFVRGDASRTDGGSGLGLSIASSFTEACGGTFQVETVADLFTAIVTFPIEGN